MNSRKVLKNQYTEKTNRQLVVLWRIVMVIISNHGFKKPEYSDAADIADLNFNFDKIDQMPVLYRQFTEPTNKIAGKLYGTTLQVRF